MFNAPQENLLNFDSVLKELQKREADAKNMALLKAGLAMVSQKPSPYPISPLQSIAEGMQVGYDSYQKEKNAITDRKLLMDKMMWERQNDTTKNAIAYQTAQKKSGHQYKGRSANGLPVFTTGSGEIYELQKDGTQKPYYNEITPQTTPYTDADIMTMSRSLGDGTLSPAYVPARGNARLKVFAGTKSLYPKFNQNMAMANSNFWNSSRNRDTMALVPAVMDRIHSLEKKARALGNENFTPRNALVNAVKRIFGDKTVTDFDSALKAIVNEVQVALTGGSSTSDMRIKIELDNLNENLSLPQMLQSLANLQDALSARLEAVYAVPFPFEVMIGKMSPEEHAQNVMKKYRINTKTNPPVKKVVRRGIDKNTRKNVVQYDDGSISYE